MLAAGLLAKKAVEAGLRVQPHIKTSSPGSRIVTEYLRNRLAAVPGKSWALHWRATARTTRIGNAGDLA